MSLNCALFSALGRGDSGMRRAKAVAEAEPSRTVGSSQNTRAQLFMVQQDSSGLMRGVVAREEQSKTFDSPLPRLPSQQAKTCRWGPRSRTAWAPFAQDDSFMGGLVVVARLWQAACWRLRAWTRRWPWWLLLADGVECGPEGRMARWATLPVQPCPRPASSETPAR